MIEVAEFDAVCEQHAIALPIEAIGQDHFALGAGGHSGQLDRALHTVADFQVDLTLMGSGESVRFPERHCTILTESPVPIRTIDEMADPEAPRAAPDTLPSL